MFSCVGEVKRKIVQCNTREWAPALKTMWGSLATEMQKRGDNRLQGRGGNMARHVSNSTWWLLLTSAHSRFPPTCIPYDLISVFPSPPFTSAPPKHPFRRIPFVYLCLRNKSIKKRRQCKHFALICSHKAVIKRDRTICFVEVTARNKGKCNNYLLKIHVALPAHIFSG